MATDLKYIPYVLNISPLNVIWLQLICNGSLDVKMQMWTWNFDFVLIYNNLTISIMATATI